MAAMAYLPAHAFIGENNMNNAILIRLLYLLICWHELG